MSFKIIKAEERITRMLQWLTGIQTKITDTFVGGVTRSKLESVAVEMEQQDFAFYRALKKAIPTSIYRAFDFTRLDAVRASGNVTFSIDVAAGSDIVIPSGTRVATSETETSPERVYETLAEGTLLTGNTEVDILCACTQPGEYGNTGAGTITILKTVIADIDSVTNGSAFVNGAEKETEEDRHERFKQYISTLARGTLSALEYGAKTATLYDGSGSVTEKVLSCLVVDKPRATAGFADIFIYNGTGATSAELVTEAQKIIDGYVGADGKKVAGWKAAGVVVTVAAAGEITQDVTANITVSAGVVSSVVQTAAEGIIDEYIKSLDISDQFIVAEIIERIMGINGVYNVSIATPSSDITPSQTTAPTHTGSGTDDMSNTGSVFTGEGKSTYRIEIDGTGTPDTFKWSNDGGDSFEVETVSIVGGDTAQVLEDGIQVAFTASTGHTLGDYWEFTASRAEVVVAGTVTVNVSGP